MESVSMESPNFHTRPRINLFRAQLLEDLPGVHDFSGHRRRRHGERSAEIDFGVETALAPFVVARRRGDADFTVRHVADLGLAHAASRRNHLRTRLYELRDEPRLETFQVDLLRGG